MRDKNRIPKILKELERVWKKNPDLRLGQLIMIAARPKDPCPRVFYVEDDEMLNGIQAFGNKTMATANKHESVPYWELYPQIILIDIEDVTIELVAQFIEAIRKEKPNYIITPRSMMRLLGAPVDDLSWLSTQKERIEKLDRMLKGFESKGTIKVAEIGYQIKN